MASKAFMSDIDGGPTFLDLDRISEECFGRPGEAFAAEWAIREAERILAETEQCFTDMVPLNGFAYGSVCPDADFGRNLVTTGQALAESLSAFLASEVQ